MRKLFYLLSVLFIFNTACNDPVFYSVSVQTKIEPPLIPGSPTNILAINNRMFLASGTEINYYEGINNYDERNTNLADFWTKENLGIGRIIQLASDNNILYILTEDSKLYRYSQALEPMDENPITLPGHSFNSMYSANNIIFLSSIDNDEKSHILYVSGNEVKEIIVNTGDSDEKYMYLRGVVHNGANYFFCIKDLISRNGGGILVGNTSFASLIEDNYTIPFMGILHIDGGDTIAINRNGVIYTVNANEVTPITNIINNNQTPLSTRFNSNGVLFVWVDHNTGSRLLLAGRQEFIEYSTSVGYRHGYLEIEIGSTGSISGTSFREPGLALASDEISTIPLGQNELFKSTIGKIPVKYFFQANNDTKTLFASTQQDGFWSLKPRANPIFREWNAEK